MFMGGGGGGGQTFWGKFMGGGVLHGGLIIRSCQECGEFHKCIFPTMVGYSIKDKTLTILFIFEVNS